jgi:two-component system response regulator AtoC
VSEQRVLVVAGDPSVRENVAQGLRQHGYTALLAGTGAEALALLETPTAEAVVLDGGLSGPGGRLLLDELVGAYPDTPVLVIGVDGTTDPIEFIRRGAHDYLTVTPLRVADVILALRKVEERARLRSENRHLREALGREVGLGGFVGQAPSLQRLFDTIRKVADYKTTVLVTGESGTGKELVARALHQLGARSVAPFVAVNCGAIPEHLLESELFGHRKGAFTDAIRDKRGLFEAAHRGTLFLDEIGELPLGLQVKLLRALQEETIHRLGDPYDFSIDVRVIAATVRNLEAMSRGGTFREDLYYRLNVIHLELPPLRQHPEDVPLLVEHFLRRASARLGRPIARVRTEALKRLMAYDWPGNVRELENCLEHSAVLCEGEEISLADLPSRFRDPPEAPVAPAGDGDLSIKRGSRRMERELIRRALIQTHGNRTNAAKLLEISHRALLYKMKDYELTDL